MAGLVLATPGGITPPPAAPTWTHMRHRWDAWDGTSWRLSSRDSGVFLLAGVRGLTMPPIDRFSSASPAVAGSRYRGNRTDEREAFWPVKVWNDQSSQDWIEYDRAWWKTLDPDKVGSWVVTQPNGDKRSLRLRFVDDGNPSFDTDPARAGWTRYGITLVAEEPYWMGDPITREWAASNPVDFFGASGGPSFFISSGHTLDNATITNDGNVEAWPVWRIDGPTTSVDLGVDGQTIEVPFTIAAGEAVVIDTDPRVQTAVQYDTVDGVLQLPGLDRTEDLGEVGFAPVPAGASVPLDLNMVGTGNVSISLVPRYYRAW
jgi:hypothetical protein